MTPIRRWRIHLGAHKTATTHIQDTLANGRDLLRAEGIDYIPLSALREAWLYPRVLETARYRGYAARLRPQAARRRVEDLIAPMRQDLDTLVLSEENLLGPVRGLLGGGYYPRAERVTRLIRCLGPDAEVTICIALRSPDTLLPSAYVQHLRHDTPPPGGFASIRARAIARPPRWSEFLFRLRRAAGARIRFRIWRYEDYRDRRGEIVGGICGGLTAPLPDVPVPHGTRRVCAEAVAQAEALSPAIPRDERRLAVAAIFAASPAGAPPFAPFSREERSLLAESHARDLDRIAATFGPACFAFGGEPQEVAPMPRWVPLRLPALRRARISP